MMLDCTRALSSGTAQGDQRTRDDIICLSLKSRQGRDRKPGCAPFERQVAVLFRGFQYKMTVPTLCAGD